MIYELEIIISTWKIKLAVFKQNLKWFWKIRKSLGVFLYTGKSIVFEFNLNKNRNLCQNFFYQKKFLLFFTGDFQQQNFKIGASILRALFYGKCPFLLVSDAALIFQIRLWRYIFPTCYMTSSWSHDQRVMWLYLGACHGMSPPCQVWWI